MSTALPKRIQPAVVMQADARRWKRIVARFPKVRLLIVGDVMLDQFIRGRVSRISPEAPVPVVEVTEESFHLGGAANVAANVRALGGYAAIVGVVGTDAHGRRMARELAAIGVSASGLVRGGGMATIRKTRILAHQQQVVRLDREPQALPERLVRTVVERAERLAAEVDGVVVSDYNKGVVTRELLERLAERPGGRPLVFIDPKQKNFGHYANATLVKPNLAAATAASGIDIVDDRSLERAGERLLDQWQSEAVLISRGEEGMALFRRGRAMELFPTMAREVYDVTGAGDTVLATAALARAAGASFEDAAVLANCAAGVVVGKLGTATVDGDELVAAIDDLEERARR